MLWKRRIFLLSLINSMILSFIKLWTSANKKGMKTPTVRRWWWTQTKFFWDWNKESYSKYYLPASTNSIHLSHGLSRWRVWPPSVWLHEAITTEKGILNILVFPANLRLYLAGLLRCWCTAAASRWVLRLKRLSSSCRFCHYGGAPQLVAPRSTYSNTTGKEHQHYISWAYHRRANRLSRATEVGEIGW